MVRISFPGAAATDSTDHQHRRPRDRDTLHSFDLWDLLGGAAGDECFSKVKKKTEKRKATENAASQKKEQRVAQHEHRAADEFHFTCLSVSRWLDHFHLIEQQLCRPHKKEAQIALRSSLAKSLCIELI